MSRRQNSSSGSSGTIALAGWLFADLLLAFALFFLIAQPGRPPQPPEVDEAATSTAEAVRIAGMVEEGVAAGMAATQTALPTPTGTLTPTVTPVPTLTPDRQATVTAADAAIA